MTVSILLFSAGTTAVAAAAAATTAAAAAGGKDRRHLNGQSVRQHPYPRTWFVNFLSEVSWLISQISFQSFLSLANFGGKIQMLAMIHWLDYCL